jgi:C-terminal processing protease CtpA/Prc
MGSLLYVQINTIANTPTETLAQFAGRLREEIAVAKPQKVAIDLRLNRGGNAMLNVPVIRALIQSPAIDHDGRLFAIIGPATFSAAQQLAVALEEYTHVTFVGEPSGSKGNAFGDSRKITLPNSGITVRASIYYWQNWHPMDKRDAIVPKILAPLTMDDYRNNADPAIVAITSR